MSQDVCPTCGIPWPKFCPKDGTKLTGPGICPNNKAGAAPADKATRLEMEPVKRSTGSGLGAGMLDQLTGDKKVEVPANLTPAAKKKKRKRSGFSETQWFMKGVESTESLDEGAPKDEHYVFDENISEEDRKKFTLRRDEEEEEGP